MNIPLMIDSGAYSAWSKKEDIDLDAYIQFCKDVGNENEDTIFINLDVIGDGKGSYHNWKTMLEAGIKTLPIYHVITEEKWLLRYLKQTDHIGIGAIANMSSEKRKKSLDRIWSDYLIDENRMPKYKVHGMGITSFKLVKRYPWHSVDSTSWLMAGIFGKVFLPHKIKGEWRYDDQPYVLGFSSKSTAKKQKGSHFENVNPAEKRTLEEYLTYVDMEYGESRFEVDEKGKNKEIVIKKGVSNNNDLRCFLNALFFSRFMQALTWPRPFNVKIKKGLLA